MKNEIWQPVYEWEGFYEVSSLGRVKSLHKRKRHDPILRPAPNSSGYLYVGLSNGSKHRSAGVHRLVLEAFTKSRPNLHAAHKNNVRNDNRLENLYWATIKENNKEKFKHGTVLQGERHPGVKLSAKDVLEIRRAVAAGDSQSRLAEDYKVTRTTIHEIGKRKSWRHI